MVRTYTIQVCHGGHGWTCLVGDFFADWDPMGFHLFGIICFGTFSIRIEEANPQEEVFVGPKGW